MRRRPGLAGALRARQGSQALVEFGIVAILFVTILFGIVDFGLLLNGWMTVNAGAREGARQGAAGGHVASAVFPAAQRYAPAGVSASDLKVTANYCDDKAPFTCYKYYTTSSAMPAPYGCVEPPDTCVPSQWVDPQDPDSPQVQPGFSLTVIVLADTFEVITPLVRPFFGCSGAAANCYVPLVGKATMRYEGPL